LSLWSLEALYKLSDTVSTTVKTITDAIADITKEIKEVSVTPRPPMADADRPKAPGTRSKELETACLTRLESLERSFSDLAAMQTHLERKVELNTRYSNAVRIFPSCPTLRRSF
jgi:hypothetical protein